MATTADITQVDELRTGGVEVRGLAFFDTDFGKCDVCPARGVRPEAAMDAVVEGKTVFGVWGRMCPGCFREAGVGLGVGRGQVLLRS